MNRLQIGRDHQTFVVISTDLGSLFLKRTSRKLAQRLHSRANQIIQSADNKEITCFVSFCLNKVPCQRCALQIKR